MRPSPSVYQPSPTYHCSMRSRPRSIALREASGSQPTEDRKPATVTGKSSQLQGQASAVQAEAVEFQVTPLV